MPNPNAPFGFAVVGVDGKECRAKEYTKASGAIYQGDVVKLQSTGDVAVAAAGDRILGVAAETRASADTTILVYDDPRTEFIAQCDGAFAAADVGQTANITATAADTTLERSKHDIDIASFGTGVAQFKLLGLYSRGDNAVGSYAIVRVIPAYHEFMASFAGV